MLVKCKPNRMVRNTENFELFGQKWNNFGECVDSILEDVSVLETIFDAKVLIIKRL